MLVSNPPSLAIRALLDPKLAGARRCALISRKQINGAGADQARPVKSPVRYFSRSPKGQEGGEKRTRHKDPLRPLVLYAFLGVLCFSILARTLFNFPLIPFQLSSLEWLKNWLLMTVIDYYGAVLPLCGIILASEKPVKAALWSGKRPFIQRRV